MAVNIDKPLFIVGVGRSGTTLLQSILNSHENITFTPETHFFRFYLGNQKKSKVNKKKIIKEIEEDRYFQRLKIDTRKILEDYKSTNSMRLIDVYKRLLIDYANSQEKMYVGDKDPKNIELLHLIKKYFPGAIIIYMVRDPRDVIVSRMKAEWSRGRSIYAHIFAYKAQSLLAKKYGQMLFNENFIKVSYEKLLKEPESILRPLCEHLGVEYTNTMLKFQQSAKNLVSDDEMQWKKESIGPLLKNNTGKWKGNLSKYYLSLIEQTLKKSFIDERYTPSYSFKNINIFQFINIKFLEIVYSIFSRLYVMNRVKSVKKI
ncbi:sulfotransferase family protein [Halobacillus massiliensis]|uniref:sulfotransferase family protein n=1 Tax=Halobacillus massiliensis TaxID=1926286 RepID=UPI0015C4B4D9|nr:sulfotransferase [Halobacillus massiliensis]